MAHTSTLLLASLLHLSCLSSAYAVSDPGDVTTPEEHLGRPVGRDFELVDWPEVSSYFHKLGGESARVETVKVGESTEGRDFLLSIISSPRNLKDLDAIRENARLLADPRGASEERLEEAVREGKVVLFISCANPENARASKVPIRPSHRYRRSPASPLGAAGETWPQTPPDGPRHLYPPGSSGSWGL